MWLSLISELSVPAADAGAISGSRNAESKTPSQWNDGSLEAGTVKATAALGELPYAALMLWLMIQSHDPQTNVCLRTEQSRFSVRVLEQEMQSPTLQFTFLR
jgi:hypothetical protein